MKIANSEKNWRVRPIDFQFQFQFFTLNLQNSDKTQSRPIEWDYTFTRIQNPKQTNKQTNKETNKHPSLKEHTKGPIPEPRKIMTDTIIARRRRGTWEGVPTATWCIQ